MALIRAAENHQAHTRHLFGVQAGADGTPSHGRPGRPSEPLPRLAGASWRRARGRWLALGAAPPAGPRSSRGAGPGGAGTPVGEAARERAREQASERARPAGVGGPRTRTRGRGHGRGRGPGGDGGRGPGGRARRRARVINYARTRAARGAGAGSAPRWRPPQSRPPQPRRLCSPAAPPGPRVRAVAASLTAAAAVSRPGAPATAPFLTPGSSFLLRDPGAGLLLSSQSGALPQSARRGSRGRGAGFLPSLFWTGVWKSCFLLLYFAGGS